MSGSFNLRFKGRGRGKRRIPLGFPSLSLSSSSSQVSVGNLHTSTEGSTEVFFFAAATD